MSVRARLARLQKAMTGRGVKTTLQASNVAEHWLLPSNELKLEVRRKRAIEKAEFDWPTLGLVEVLAEMDRLTCPNKPIERKRLRRIEA